MFTRETAGMTRANLSVDPLATEAESAPIGDSSYNPYDDPQVSEGEKRRMDLSGYSPVETEGGGQMGLDPESPLRDRDEREPFIPL